MVCMLPAGLSCPSREKAAALGQGMPQPVRFCGQTPPNMAFLPPDVPIIAQARHNKKAGAAFLAFFLVFGAGEGPLFPPAAPKMFHVEQFGGRRTFTTKPSDFFKVWPPRGCYTLLIGRGVAPAKKEAPPMTFPGKEHPDPSGGRRLPAASGAAFRAKCCGPACGPRRAVSRYF